MTASGTSKAVRYDPGFRATLEIRENLENEFPFFSSQETPGNLGNHNKSGELREFVRYPEGEGFSHF